MENQKVIMLLSIIDSRIILDLVCGSRWASAVVFVVFVLSPSFSEWISFDFSVLVSLVQCCSFLPDMTVQCCPFLGDTFI